VAFSPCNHHWTCVSVHRVPEESVPGIPPTSPADWARVGTFVCGKCNGYKEAYLHVVEDETYDEDAPGYA